jgi:hypothetical protein
MKKLEMDSQAWGQTVGLWRWRKRLLWRLVSKEEVIVAVVLGHDCIDWIVFMHLN